MLEKDRNKETSTVLREIKRHVEDGEMSFLIGAGFSRNVNADAYPLWGDLLKDAVWDLFGTGDRVKHENRVVDNAVRKYGYLGIASMMVKKAGYHEAIDTYIEERTPFLKTENGKPELFLNGVPLHKPVRSDCHLLLKKLNIQNIYTFNYDNALEFFMGDEARQDLESKIHGMEEELIVLRKEATQLEQKVESLMEELYGSVSHSFGKEVMNAPETGSDERSDNVQLKKELEQTQDLRKEHKKKIVETSAGIDANKLEIKSFYNLVKDAYEISLSAKRKSIFKIHGSLREHAEVTYGFDGDAHVHYIITQEDYDTYNEKHGAFVNMMRIDLLRNRFCILGVSGGDANFLAWINWVKDVLDKTKARTKGNDSECQQSYFIYSGTRDMKQEMVLMLKNHFIQPVILKDIFPTAKSDGERVRLFLESIQPLSNEAASQCAELWGRIEPPNPFLNTTKPVTQQIAEELFRLSSANRFNASESIIHRTSTNVQFAVKSYLKKKSNLSDKMVYAAALQCSLLPFDLSYHTKDALSCIDRETDSVVKKVYVAAVRRAALLSNLNGSVGALIDSDEYSRILNGLFNFRFPLIEDILLKLKSGNTGLDFIRKYSLLKLMHSDITNAGDCNVDDFHSPQELVLATNWLKRSGYKNPSLYKKADEIKQHETLFGLKDYCRSYLTAMQREEEISSYGNVTETIYFGQDFSDVTNASVLLNSFVELGICSSFHSLLSDREWIAIVKSLKDRYAAALAFYTIACNSKEKVIKVVAQELMYGELSRKALPSILKNIMSSLVSENTPDYLKGKMALFATCVLPAVNVRQWSHQFKSIVEKLLDIADQNKPGTDSPKFLYGFVSNAIAYTRNIELRLQLLNRILVKDSMNDRLDNHFNTLVISARGKLKPADFAPYYHLYYTFAKNANKSDSEVMFFIVANLLILVDGVHKLNVLKLLENRALKDAYFTELYASHIREYPELLVSFKEKFIIGEDLWHSGIDETTVRFGLENIRISLIDKYVTFDKEQVAYIYNDLKKTLDKIISVFNRNDHEKEDEGWMSFENNFRELVMDMRLFVHKHENQLMEMADFGEVGKRLFSVYEQCFFGKTILQLVADDKIYRAIRRLVVETELYGIDCYNVEYGQILGKLLTKDCDELGICFKHIAWAINTYNVFFDTDEFKQLLQAILAVYKPYFDVSDGKPKPWNLIGCQKEVAEKALLSISKTLSRWGYVDSFWNRYKSIYKAIY